MHSVHQSEAPAGSRREAAGDPFSSLPPLRVGGVVVHKRDLIAALRGVYLPGLADIRVSEDGETFWFILGPKEAADA